MQYTSWLMQCTTVRLLMHMMASAVHWLESALHPSELPDVHNASAVHLMVNAAHPSEAPDVHDGIYSTPVGKCSTPK